MSSDRREERKNGQPRREKRSAAGSRDAAAASSLTPPKPASEPASQSASKSNRGKSPPHSSPSRSSSSIRIRPFAAGEFELLHPRCALERAEDMEEARAMVAAGEIEIAIDEIRWLLSGCHDFIDAHRLLGELALADDDLTLARGHFGIAFQLGVKAFGNSRGTLPYRLAANQGFHESGKGLLWCLARLGKADLADEVAKTLLRLDPLDPLAIKRLLSETTARPAATDRPQADSCE
ncbi:MAG: hypothetical protein WD875_05345 [Pirellulales bacterium]